MLRGFAHNGGLLQSFGAPSNVKHALHICLAFPLVVFEIELQLLVAARFEAKLLLSSSACFLCTSHLHPLLVLCEIELQLLLAAGFETKLLLGSSECLLAHLTCIPS